MTDGPTQPIPAGPQTLGDGRYVLHDRLGTGGMGIVLRGTDTRLGRDVAIKLLADNLAADDVARERFLREARAAARIPGPYVVQVYDVDEQDGRPYFVMELIEGPSLERVLAEQGPLDPEELVGVAADALAALSQAHDAGVLHRDVKPGNLLRTSAGAVKVTDFGVAQAADEELLTHTGMVVGTGPYLAPERAAGQAATVRTDLYALGATLHQLATGERPEPDSPVDAELPPRLARLLERLLARDPQQRPASAEAALALLADEIDTGPEAPTEAIAPVTGPSPDATDEPTAARAPEDDRDAEPAEPGPPPPPSAPPGSRLPWRSVVGIAVALLVVALAFQLVGGGGDGEDADPAGVERSEDPAETARNLADWLERRAGD